MKKAKILAAMAGEHNQPLCSTREAAQILGVSLRTVQLWVDSGILLAWKTVGGHRRITLESVERLKNEGVATNTPATAVNPGVNHAGDIYLARQPILDKQQRIVAYELLYRSGPSNRADVTDGMEASSRVITYAFSDLGIGAALGRSDCYINVNKAMLMSDAIQMLPRGSTTLELTESIEVSDELIACCKKLKSSGFKLALDDYVAGSGAERLLPIADVIKVDLLSCDDNCLEHTVSHIRRSSRARLLAEKVETEEQFRRCLDMGFDLFQGYYFARPHIIVGKRTHPAQFVLLRLLKVVMSDAPNIEIERILKGEPNLCYNLFRLVNSVAMGINRKITAINEVITMLGRRQLQRWVYLLLFAQQDTVSYPSPLLQTAALRGKLMEKLAIMASPNKSEFHEHAFMTGILSLLNALLGLPMEEILAEIRVVDEVHDALLARQGKLGRMLALCETLESEDLRTLPTFLDEFQLDSRNVMQAQVDALQWSNAVGEAIHQ